MFLDKKGKLLLRKQLFRKINYSNGCRIQQDFWNQLMQFTTSKTEDSYYES